MKFLKGFLIVLCICVSSNLRAQESLLDEIDYAFLDSLIAKAKTNYPRNKILSSKTELAKNNIARANVSWLDALNFNYIYGNNSVFNLENPSSLINGYQAGINLNLGMILDKPFKIKNAKTEHTITKLEEQEYSLFLTNEVKKRYFTYIQYLSTLKIRTKSSQDASAAAEEIKHKYEKGEASFEIYNSSLISLSNQLQYKIEAEGSFFTAKAALEEIIGQRLEEIKVNGRN